MSSLDNNLWSLLKGGPHVDDAVLEVAIRNGDHDDDLVELHSMAVRHVPRRVPVILERMKALGIEPTEAPPLASLDDLRRSGRV